MFTLVLCVLAVYESEAQSATALDVTPQKLDAVLAGSDRVAVFYSETGCSDCNAMRPLWQALATEYGGSIALVEVRYSTTTAPLFGTYNIMKTPTFILFVGGVRVAEHEGTFASTETMNEFLQTDASSGSSGPASSSLSPQMAFLTSESPSLVISAILGVGVFASPCVLPLLPGYVGFLAARPKGTKRSIELSSISSFAAGAVGIMLVGSLFILLGNLFWPILLGGKLVISFALMALGLAALLGVGLFHSGARILGAWSSSDRIRGISTYALLYGFLSLGCSLPFMIGGMLNILAGVGVYSMASRLLVFAFGFSAPLAVLTYATQKGVSISASRLGKSSSILQKVGGAAMVAASVLLLVTL